MATWRAGNFHEMCCRRLRQRRAKQRRQGRHRWSPSLLRPRRLGGLFCLRRWGAPLRRAPLQRALLLPEMLLKVQLYLSIQRWVLLRVLLPPPEMLRSQRR